MRTDTKALMWVVGSSAFVAVLVICILFAAALKWITIEVAAPLALVCLVVGGIMIGRTFSRGLMTRGEDKTVSKN
ncbi:MAG TPA: hypothetical protein VGJ05_16675 [Fimbriiglobus sp.]